MQRDFLSKNAGLFKQMEDEATGARGCGAGANSASWSDPDSKANSLAPGFEGNGQLCCVGASRAPFDCSLDRLKCIYCQEEELVSAEAISGSSPKDHGPLLYLAFVQRSTLFSSATGTPLGMLLCENSILYMYCTVIVHIL